MTIIMITIYITRYFRPVHLRRLSCAAATMLYLGSAASSLISPPVMTAMHLLLNPFRIAIVFFPIFQDSHVSVDCSTVDSMYTYVVNIKF